MSSRFHAPSIPKLRGCPICGGDYYGDEHSQACPRCELYIGDHKKRSIPGHVRREVIRRDGYVCQLCGGPVARTAVHMDHIIPELHGGAATVENLQVAHAYCNKRKGARLPVIAGV